MSDSEAVQNPWQFLAEKYYTLERGIQSESNSSAISLFTFKCLLCQPKVKFIAAHSSSISNLKLHVQRVHTPEYSTFLAFIKKKLQGTISSPWPIITPVHQLLLKYNKYYNDA